MGLFSLNFRRFNLPTDNNNKPLITGFKLETSLPLFPTEPIVLAVTTTDDQRSKPLMSKISKVVILGLFFDLFA